MWYNIVIKEKEKIVSTREERIKNKFVGAHVSTTGGVFNAPKNAKEIGARCV